MNMKLHLMLVFLVSSINTFKVINAQLNHSKKSAEDFKILTILDSTNKTWDKVSRHLIMMMQNSDFIQNDKLDVTIYEIGSGNSKSLYEGFLQSLSKHLENSITISLYGSLSVNHIKKIQMDFLIILIDEVYTGYENLINKHFNRIFKDKPIKIFVILSFKSSYNNLNLVFNSLIKLKYYNVHLVMHKASGNFLIYRAAMTKSEANEVKIYAQKYNGNKFSTMKDTLTGTDAFPIKVVFYDSYPRSYVKNGEIIGAEGNLIREFSNKLNTNYEILND